MTANRRATQRLATRQQISNAATSLFLEWGFDSVTVDEIATAAKVGRMTVFNHFPRKEDMFFDRTDEVRDMLGNVLREGAANVSPVEKLRLAAHALIAENSRYVEFSVASQHFAEAIKTSDALSARLRGIRAEISQYLAECFISKVGAEVDISLASLASATLLATWAVAFSQAHHVFKETMDRKRAEAIFLDIVDRGSSGLQAALAGTPLV